MKTGTRVKLEKPLIQASGYKPIQDVPVGSEGTIVALVGDEKKGLITGYTVEWDDPAFGKTAFDPASGHRVLLKLGVTV